MEDPVKIYKDVLKIAGESKANEDGYTTKDDPAICPNCNSDSFGYIMNGQRYEFEDVQSNGKVKCDSCGGEFTPRELVTIADGYYKESKANEEIKYDGYGNIDMEDGWSQGQWNELDADMDSMNKHDKKINKWREQGLTDDEIRVKLQNGESKASEGLKEDIVNKLNSNLPSNYYPRETSHIKNIEDLGNGNVRFGYSGGVINDEIKNMFESSGFTISNVNNIMDAGHLDAEGKITESYASEDWESQQRGLSDSEEEELIEQTLDEWQTRYLPYTSAGQDVSKSAFASFATSKNLTQSEIDYLWDNGANPYSSEVHEEETELFDDKRGDIDDWGEIEDISQEPEDRRWRTLIPGGYITKL